MARRRRRHIKLPDWSLYGILLAMILIYAMNSNNDVSSITPPPLGAALPDIQPSDQSVLVDIDGPRTSGSGTAFAIDGNGTWLTARHVVESCDEVGLIAGTGRAIKVDKVDISKDSDTAVLETRWTRSPIASDLYTRRTLREPGYFFGFPQGRPGEVAGSLLGRHQLITRGRYNSKEAILAWAELGRTRGLSGSIGGMSGGPVLDADGEVIGVVAAESPRRGRIYTVAPSSIRTLMPKLDAPANARAISLDSFGTEADRYRRDRRIAQVICLVEK